MSGVQLHKIVKRYRVLSVVNGIDRDMAMTLVDLQNRPVAGSNDDQQPTAYQRMLAG